MSVKIKISYENERELKEVIALLKSKITDYKLSKNQEGRYKKAYIYLK